MISSRFLSVKVSSWKVGSTLLNLNNSNNYINPDHLKHALLLRAIPLPILGVKENE